MDIGPGDAVECLHDSEANYGLQATRAGRTYFVRCLVFDNTEQRLECHQTPPGLVLMGDSPDRNACHCMCNFRPFHGPELAHLNLTLKEPA